MRCAFVLVDSRHGIKAPDQDIMTMLDKAAVTFQVVMTKTDKMKAPELAKVMARVRADLAKHPAAFPELILTSSDKGTGIETLRSVIAGIE